MLHTRQWVRLDCVRRKDCAISGRCNLVYSPSAPGYRITHASQLPRSRPAELQPWRRPDSQKVQRLCALIKDKQADHEDIERFQVLLNQLKSLSYQELLHLSEGANSADTQAAFSASFLFWLSAQEKKATGVVKQELSNLAAQLVYIKEQSDYEASRRMLPPLASSLAYRNYNNWQADNQGKQLPDVAPGVSVADLYKAAGREEAKLQQWQTKQRSPSTVDTFAAASGYQQAAAEAMARVRARLMGFTDDETYGTEQQGMQDSGGSSHAPSDASQHTAADSTSLSPAAQLILQELLMRCSCREERATVLPEAMMPPGLQVLADRPVRIVTSPQRLLDVIRLRQQQQQQQLQGAVQAGQVAVIHVEEQLPSGETLHQVLSELSEDVKEFDQHVYSRMSRRDLRGRF